MQEHTLATDLDRALVERLATFVDELVAGADIPPARRTEVRLEFLVHLEAETRAGLARGETARAAVEGALARFGSPQLIRRQLEAAHRPRRPARGRLGRPGLGGWLQDARHGLRALARAPGFTLVAVLTMALGIGVTTAVFSLANAALFRPLPYPDADRLVGVADRPWIPVEAFEAWRRDTRACDAIAAYYPREFTVTTDRATDVVEGAAVTGDYLPLLGARVVSGRAFLPEETEPGGARVAIVGGALFRRLFGADATIGDRTITIDDEPHRIVGVLDPAFRHYGARAVRPGVWVPLVMPPPVREDGALNYVIAVARLAPVADRRLALAELAGEMSRVGRDHPGALPTRSRPLALQTLRDVQAGGSRPALMLLLLASLGALVTVCANVTSLLLARATARRREMAVRAALGAGRVRLGRQLGIEALLLAALGGLAAVVVATVGLDLLVALVPDSLPRVGEISVDRRVLGFAIAVVMAAGLLSGLLPAVAAIRTDLRDALASGARNVAGASRDRRTLEALVVLETTVALVLAASAGLMLRSLDRLERVDPGFDARGVLTARVVIPEDRLDSARELSAFWAAVEARLDEQPGIAASGLSNNLPIARAGASRSLDVEGREEPLDAEFGVVSPSYFEAVRIPLLRGRAFTQADGPNAAPVAVVDAAFARAAWPGADPIGRRVRWDDEPATPWMTVVGVAGNVRGRGRAGRVGPGFYIPVAQRPDTLVERLMARRMYVVARATGEDALALAPAVAGAVRAVEPRQPVTDVTPLARIMADEISPERLRTILLSLFGAIAFVVAAIGIYGVMSYAVAQQSYEIGVRAALGAGRTRLVGEVLARAATLALAGVVMGTAAALALGRVLAGLLFEVSPSDPATFGATAAGLLIVALAAAWRPARQAAAIDPLVAIRAE